MRFSLKKPRENTVNFVNLSRLLGYRLLRGIDNEFNLVRPLAGDYPRFHIYLKEENNLLNFNLHIDQKKPSYSKQIKHSGEYDGELILGEKQRIEKILLSLF